MLVNGTVHSRNFQDLTGERYGRLTFVKFIEKTESGSSKWLMRCDCGTEFIAHAGNVKQGGTKSCGCLRSEMLRERNMKRRSSYETQRTNRKSSD